MKGLSFGQVNAIGRRASSGGGVTQLHRVIDLVNSGASPERIKEWCEKQIAKHHSRTWDEES